MNENNNLNNNKVLIITITIIIAITIIGLVLFLAFKPKNNTNDTNDTNDIQKVEQIVYYNNSKTISEDFLSLVLLSYDENTRYVITINEKNIATNLIDTKKYFGNETFNVSTVGNSSLESEIRFKLNNNSCFIDLRKEWFYEYNKDTTTIIKENKKLFMTKNSKDNNYDYYFNIDGYYIHIILYYKSGLTEEKAIEFFEYLNEHFSIQKVNVEGSLVINDLLSNSVFLSDKILDSLREKGFNLKNVFGLQVLSKLEDNLIDYSVYFNTDIPQYEKIYCDIKEVTEYVYNNYSKKADDTFDVNDTKIQSGRSSSAYPVTVAIKNGEKYYTLKFKAYNSENQKTAFDKETLKKVVTDFLTIK